jgi:quercetin dioxygenase-like cupin family protein
MDNKKYVDLVNSQQYPKEIQVPLDPPFKDQRGIIQNLWLGDSKSVTYIESKVGAVRAKHKHTVDYHATYVLEGSIKYSELEDDEKTLISSTVYRTGEMFFTKPGVFHIMEFLKDTKMITVNGIVKNHENYEADIVRVK